MKTKLNQINELIEVSDTRFNFFPKTFFWRGKAHHVRSVDRCWTVSRRRWLSTVERHCFRVRTASAIYELHQDLAQNLWYLDRVIGGERNGR
jgi:hypothetical protein